MLLDYEHKVVDRTKSDAGDRYVYLPAKAIKTYISTLIDAGVNINTIREMVGHEDERATYNSYCFDRTDKSERMKIIEAALS